MESRFSALLRLPLLAAVLASAGEFGVDFLEGRIVGGSAHDVLAMPRVSPDGGQGFSSVRDLWRLGSADSFESRLWLAGGYRVSGPDEWRLGTAGWSGTLRPDDGAQLTWNWRMANFWLGYDDREAAWSHGLESGRPVELRQSFRFKMLGNDGKIVVDKEDYALLFYRNPQVDAGQVEWEIRESHAFAAVGILADTVGAGIRYGLFRPLEAGVAFLAERNLTRGRKKWEATDWDGALLAHVGWFHGPFRAKADGNFGLWESAAQPELRRALGLEADLVLFGSRIFSEVAGNWDGWFDRTAPAGQLMLSARAGAWSVDDMGSGPDTLRLSAMLGLPLRLAVDGGALFLDGGESPDWGVGLSWCSVPLRLGDPKRHDAIEALYGLAPEPWTNLVLLDYGDGDARRVGAAWTGGLPGGFSLSAELSFLADDGAEFGYGSAGLGWGNRHLRLALGAQLRSEEAAGAADLQGWRTAHDGTPARGFRSRVWGDGTEIPPGWGILAAVRSWF